MLPAAFAAALAVLALLLAGCASGEFVEIESGEIRDAKTVALLYYAKAEG